MKQGIPIVLSAPSGTGKSTIFKRLRLERPDLKFSVSHTTRLPRLGEKDGVDYFFIDKKKFEQKIEHGEFLEWANVHGNYYGTSLDSVRKTEDIRGHTIIELDVQGVSSLRKINFDAVYIMILPPSLEELRNRLKKRSTESDEEIERRLEVGKKEITHYPNYDYVVTNNEVNKSVKIILNIFQAEEHRSTRYAPTAKDIVEALQADKDSYS